MQLIKCVIFDVDGTLTQTNELIFSAFNYVTKKYSGKTYNFEEITSMFGPPEEIALEKLLGNENALEATEDFLNFYETHHKQLARLYPGMREILENLKKKKVNLAIFTGKGRKSTLITLDELGIKNYFDIIISGNDVRSHKPSGEGINLILKHFKILRNEAIMIGDSVADVKAAQDAGVKIAAVLWDSYSKERVLQMQLDFIFENTNDLKLFLESHT